MLDLKVPPPAVALIVAIAMWGIAEIAPLTDLSLSGQTDAYRIAAAVLVAIGGIGIGGAGRHAFLKAKTTMNPLHPERTATLVGHGVYRFTRNPMYVGLLLILLAWAIALANAWTLAGLPVFLLYITRFQIVPEEQALAAKFGADYAAYKARVRRWL